MFDLILGGFRNPKTTIAAFVAFTALMLKQFGVIEIPEEQQGTIVAFAILVFGWVSGDAKATTKV